MHVCRGVYGMCMFNVGDVSKIHVGVYVHVCDNSCVCVCVCVCVRVFVYLLFV